MLHRPLLASLPALLLCLVALGTDAQPASKVELGDIADAGFRIEVPADWNGELVVYTHGYDLKDGKPFPLDASVQKAVRNGFVSRGYAYIQSLYAAEGWAIKEGLEDTEALRRYFVARYGAPKKTWVTGHSVGGLLTTLTLERYPEVYAGGLALCPVLAPALDFFESNFFDLLATFDLLVGKPEGLAPLTDPKSPVLDAKTTAAALDKNPATAELLGNRFTIRPTDLPWILAFYQTIWHELVERAGGIPIDNRNTIYAGFGDDVAVNRNILRQAADPAAELYLKLYATPTGRLEDPLLVIHTTYDPIVPPAVASKYDLLANLAGKAHLVRYRFVAADGHCTITSEQIQKAFDLLRDWAAGNPAPTPGEL